MQIAIFGGTGSIGAYFAYRLAKAQHNVTIIGRDNSENLKQIAAIGLTIQFHNETVFLPHSTFNFIGAYNYSLLNIKQDMVIVCLKQPNFDVIIAEQIMNLTDAYSAIGIISNGLPFNFLADFNLSSKAHIEATDPEGKILQLMQTREVMNIIPLMGSNTISPGVIKVVNPQNKNFHW
jgi:ketopantoate reductase